MRLSAVVVGVALRLRAGNLANFIAYNKRETLVMSVKRLTPFSVEIAKQKEVSNHNSIDSVDKCPVTECKTPMRLLNCNGIQCFVCLTHRIALPAPDA